MQYLIDILIIVVAVGVAGCLIYIGERLDKLEASNPFIDMRILYAITCMLFIFIGGMYLANYINTYIQTIPPH